MKALVRMKEFLKLNKKKSFTIEIFFCSVKHQECNLLTNTHTHTNPRVKQLKAVQSRK